MFELKMWVAFGQGQHLVFNIKTYRFVNLYFDLRVYTVHHSITKSTMKA